MLLRYTLSLLLCTCLCLAVPACAPTEGDKCEGTQAACEGTARMLYCDDGALRALECRGASGCLEDRRQDRAACDRGYQHAGDACTSDEEGLYQCDKANPNQALHCLGHAFAPEPCKACAVQAGLITCQKP